MSRLPSNGKVLSETMNEEQPRILALDIGRVRVGVAVSDPLQLTAQPGPTLDREPSGKFFEDLGRLIDQWSIRTAVVGLPIGLKGQRSGDSYADVQGLLEELERRWPAVTWGSLDERFTTAIAESTLALAPKKKRREKGIRDQMAAQIILEGYLRSKEAE